MTIFNRQYADRLLFAVRMKTIPEEERAQAIAEAHAHATLALAEEKHLANLIATYDLFRERHDRDLNERLEFPLAEPMLRRSIRRRLHLFPELDPTGDRPNGGRGEDRGNRV